MSFINAPLIWLSALAVIPVILHFLLKAKPKKLIFPALRLIKDRQQRNVQRMRLRHIWLLLLRIAAIVCLVLAVARPRVPATDYSPTWWESGTLLVIIVAALATYFVLMHRWRKQALPQHVLAHRRSFLRGGVSVAALVLCLLLVVWPFQRRISAALTEPDAPVGGNLPVAAVLLFDTSLSMQYRLESQTRLDLAKTIATDHIRRLPPRSRLAITDTSVDERILFLSDTAGALARITALETQPVAFSLNDRLRTALDLQKEDQAKLFGALPATEAEQQDAWVREIYIFTDLAATAWRLGEGSRLQQLLAEMPAVNLYLIDVGALNPVNMGITSVALSSETLALGSPLVVRAGVQETGGSGSEPAVAVFIDNETGAPIKQGQTTVKLNGSEAGIVQFPIRGLSGSVRQGEIRLLTGDPLPFDDIRYFTLEVLPPPELLLVADDPEDAQFWKEALAPSELQKVGRLRYRVTVIRPGKLTATQLRKYAAICLINVTSLRRENWQTLAKYVEEGGGVAVLTGSEVDAVSYNSPEAQAFLPARLKGHLRFLPPEFLDLQNTDHPLLKKFADWGVAELASVEIARYWRVDPIPDAAVTVIASYTDPARGPALLERPHGRGRTILFTTGVSRGGWNDLPAAGWSFLAFADQMLVYLTQQKAEKFNFTAGEDAIITLRSDETVTQYLLRTPNQQQPRGDLAPGSRTLTVRQPTQLGHYRVLGAEADAKFDRGFSLNPPAEESRLERLAPTDLDQLLGAERYGLARSPEELDRTVRRGRIGMEAYSFLIVLMLAIFISEHLVANRFYDSDQRADAVKKS